MRDWRRRNPKYMLHASAKRRALRDNIEFTISINDIPDIPETCPVALVPIHFKEMASRGPCDNSPTLDRINNNVGYVVGNIMVLSHKGNRWKSDMTIQDVERLLDYMTVNTAPGLQADSSIEVYVSKFKEALE